MQRNSKDARREAEKHEKQRKGEADKEKLQQNTKTENQKQAVQVLSKISTILPGLHRDCKDKDMKHVPKYGADPAKKSMTMLLGLKELREEVISTRGDKSLNRSSESLTSFFKDASINAALVDKLLKTAHAHAE